MGIETSVASNYGRAWFALTLALALHVTDEALTDFLSLYNPTVNSIRQRIPWLPLPVFTFEVWLAGLITAVVILLLLTRLALSNSRTLRPFAYIFAVVMLGNGLLHVGASVYLRRLAPGVLSAPVLLVAATYLVLSLRRTVTPPPHRA